MAIHRLLHHAGKHAAKYYIKNPHKAVAHGAAAVQIGSMVWTHGSRVAKHTTTFMTKAALKGFSLFRS